MGTLERDAKQKRRRQNVQQGVLLAIGVVGILAVSAVAPNTFQLLGKTGTLARLKYRTKSVLGRLKARGLIEFVEENGKRFVRITEKRRMALTIEQERVGMCRRKKWDRRYRLIMFDIPERRKRIREHLRSQMTRCGFLRIQDSAWLYPHD